MLPSRQLKNSHIRREIPLVLQLDQDSHQPLENSRRDVLQVGEREVDDVVVRGAFAEDGGVEDCELGVDAAVEDGVERA